MAKVNKNIVTFFIFHRSTPMEAAKLRYRASITMAGTIALVLAAAGRAEAANGGDQAPLIVGIHLCWIAVILVTAKLSNLITRYGQPPVLGELLVGVVFGNLGLVGFHFFDPIRGDLVIRFLAELGVVILLFQVGLESDIKKMLRVGPRALMVACVGVLAPIVGGFAAGLVLEPVYFSHFDYPAVVKDINESVRTARPDVKQAVFRVLYSFSRSHIQDLVKPLGYFFVPIFFVLTGMEVRLETLCNLQVLLLALVIALVAFVGKIAAGLVAGRVNKAIIGWGMVPRGEVGLIFAATGKAMGLVSDEIFAMIVIVIMLSTLLPPPILNFLLQRYEAAADQTKSGRS